MKGKMMVIAVAAVCLLGSVSVHAGSAAGISVTVSLVESISISLDTGTWDIGAIAAGSTHESSAFTVTNNGNVTEDISVSATDGDGGWVIGSAAGADTFKLAADVEPYSAYDVVVSGDDTEVATGVAAGAAKAFKLQYSAPTSDTKGGGVSQDFTVTLTASKH